MGITIAGDRFNKLFNRFGLPERSTLVPLPVLANSPLSVLHFLRDGFERIDPSRRFISVTGALPPMNYPPPSVCFQELKPLCGAGYAKQISDIDLTHRSPGVGRTVRSYNTSSRNHAAKLERLLRRNPSAKRAFENIIGGRIISFGKRNDGVMKIQRFVPGVISSGYSAHAPALAQCHASMASIVNGAYRCGAVSGAMLGGSAAWNAMTLAGMGHVIGQMGGVGSLGGGGVGSWNPNAMPGRINNTNPAIERAHQMQVNGILMDPSLTVEDKVSLMLMLIMKKMDRDIERQAKYINEIQQQQSNGGKKGGGGKGGIGKKGGGKKGGGNSGPSIDVETMKLKRMIDKRGQMFDMLRQIIDKYNETAKGVIQAIGR